MTTLVLDGDAASLSIGQIIGQMNGGLELRNAQGAVVAFMLPPSDFEAFMYAEAQRDLEEHREEIEKALARGGGITTAELLAKARALTDAQPSP